MKRLSSFLNMAACAAMSMALCTGSAVAADSGKKLITSEADRPKLKDWPFSPAILKDGVLYVSGTTGHAGGGKVPEVFEDEVKSALDKIGKTLELAGYGFADVVTVNVYLTDIDQISQLNKVYLTYFPEPRPARTTVQVAKLVSGAHVEITVTAKK